MSKQTIDIVTTRQALEGNYVLLLTTNSVERSAVEDVLGNASPAVIYTPTDGCRLARVGDRFVLHVTGTSRAQADRSVGRIVRKLLANRFMPRPVLVVLLGIAWGNPEKVAVGDLVLSTEVWAVNHRRITATETRHRLVQRRSPLPDLEGLLGGLGAPMAGDAFRLLTGPVASMETHYAGTKARNGLLAEYPAVLGGEMEAYDLVPDLGDLAWLLIKGISDDAGDAIDRTQQARTARRAAGLLPGLLDLLTSHEMIPAHRNDNAAASLVEAMIGHAIRVSSPADGTSNDYLNDVVGPQLLLKLGRYAADADVGGQLPRQLADVLLELSQNALRHGKATHATINFYETSVVIADNGRPFEVGDLDGSGGGSLAWRRFEERFVQPGLVRVTRRDQKGANGNIYGFKLAHISEKLRNAKQNCRIGISYGSLGEPNADVRSLQFDAQCEDLYFDVSTTLMTSRRLEIVSELLDILEMGKGVFLACHDQEEVLLYEQSLSRHAGPRLRIFVGSRV